MRRIFLTLIITLCSISYTFAEANYRVSASSRLNVRRTPSTNGAVIGTFKSGEEITVISIDRGWAKVEFNRTTGYVSAKFITALPKKIKEEPEVVEEIVEVIEEPAKEEPTVVYVADNYDRGTNTPLEMGHFMPKSMNLYLGVQAGFGWSNFLWNDGSVNGTMSYSADIIAQLDFEKRVSFIPQNWYAELALGYDKKGAADFDMSYVHARIYPLGYRIPLDPINIVVKGGVSLGFPINDLETYSNSWTSDFQCGVGGGLQIEWKQFAIGCNVEYDFTEVSSSCNQTLNNIAILGTLSYKFGKFGHK